MEFVPLEYSVIMVLSIPEYVSLAVKLKEQEVLSVVGNRNDDAGVDDKDDSDAGDILAIIRFWNLSRFIMITGRDNLTIEYAR